MLQGARRRRRRQRRRSPASCETYLRAGDLAGRPAPTSRACSRQTPDAPAARGDAGRASPRSPATPPRRGRLPGADRRPARLCAGLRGALSACSPAPGRPTRRRRRSTPASPRPAATPRLLFVQAGLLEARRRLRGRDRGLRAALRPRQRLGAHRQQPREPARQPPRRRRQPRARLRRRPAAARHRGAGTSRTPTAGSCSRRGEAEEALRLSRAGGGGAARGAAGAVPSRGRPRPASAGRRRRARASSGRSPPPRRRRCPRPAPCSTRSPGAGPGGDPGAGLTRREAKRRAPQGPRAIAGAAAEQLLRRILEIRQASEQVELVDSVGLAALNTRAQKASRFSMASNTSPPRSWIGRLFTASPPRPTPIPGTGPRAPRAASGGTCRSRRSG